MEKIKLNELEYFIKEINQLDNKLNFMVAGVTDYIEFRNTLTKENLSAIEVYSEGNVLCTLFEGYTELTGKFDIVENEDSTIDVKVYLEKPDPLTQRITDLEMEIAELKAKA